MTITLNKVVNLNLETDVSRRSWHLLNSKLSGNVQVYHTVLKLTKLEDFIPGGDVSKEERGGSCLETQTQNQKHRTCKFSLFYTSLKPHIHTISTLPITSVMLKTVFL